MSGLVPYFTGVLVALYRPVAKAQHHAPKGGLGPDGRPNCGQFAAGWNLDPGQAVQIVQLRGDEAGPSPTWREATDWAKANLRGTYQNQATGWTITVGGNGIQEGIHRLAAAHVPEAIAAIRELIAHAVPIHTGPDLKNRNYVHQVHTLAGTMSINGKPYLAIMTVLDIRDGLGYHGHQVISLDIKRPEDLGEGAGGQGPFSESHPPGSISLGQLLHGFKIHTGENQ